MDAAEAHEAALEEFNYRYQEQMLLEITNMTVRNALTPEAAADSLQTTDFRGALVRIWPRAACQLTTNL